jgi:hypothetical protein
MSYLRYLCLFAHSGVQHILWCAFVCLLKGLQEKRFETCKVNIIYCNFFIKTCAAHNFTENSLFHNKMLFRFIGPQLFVGGIMSYLRYLCLFVHTGVQHILCCVFLLFLFVLCTPYVASFSVHSSWSIVYPLGKYISLLTSRAVIKYILVA